MVQPTMFAPARTPARCRLFPFVLLCAVPGIGGQVALSVSGKTVIPQQADWTDYGLVIDASWPGDATDVVFEGLGPCGIMQKDGLYYLYWVAADDYISQLDNIGPANRAIHVATSPDGIQWTKYAGNPVISWTSSGNLEEGAVSGGVYLDSNGQFVAYYGANTASNPQTPSVWADVHLAESPDGFNFTEMGIVLDHADGAVWGSGDELHAVMTLENPVDGNWYCYYIPNGTAQAGKLGVAWGPTSDSLGQSSAVLDGGANVSARGGQSVAMLDVDTLAFFIHHGGTITARTTTWAALDQLSAPIETYSFGDGGTVNVFLENDTWYMYYKRWGLIGLRLAPASSPDGTPPTAPPGLNGTAVDHDRVELDWLASTDTDTGIVQYRVYRDAEFIGSTSGLTYTVEGATELTEHVYEVRAVNLHGTEGPGSIANVSTPADTTAPGIIRVIAGGNPNEVIVTFDEAVDPVSAETPSNYTVSHGVTVNSAALGEDSTTVTLDVTHLCPELIHDLSVQGVADQASSPNVGSPQREFTYSGAPGLVGYWRLDEDSGSTAGDSSGAAFDAQVQGTPAWGSGWKAGAMQFDGDDWVDIPLTPLLDGAATSSFTVSLMARPSSVPPATTNSNGEYSLFANAHLRVGYDANQRFVGRVDTSDGSFQITSGEIAPGGWHQVALTRDDAMGEIRLYVDGVEVPGSPVSIGGTGGGWYMESLPETSTHKEYWSTLRIGANSPLFDNFSNLTDGWIDDVRMFDRPLTPSEIAALILPATPDLDGSGTVATGDLLVLLADWGPCDGCPCLADLDGSGHVATSDLLILLAAWGS